LCYAEGMVKLAHVLIIAPPGRLRDSLGVLLHAAGVARVSEADAFHAGLQALSRSKPDLVVLDPGASMAEVTPMIQQLRRAGAAGCLVWAPTAGQVRLARRAGIDITLLPGLSADALTMILDQAAQDYCNYSGVTP
jgi:DNA-binding NarL/FixJ family response regulator